MLTDPAETGAVTIALPQDIQAHAYDYPAHFFRERRWRVERRLPDPERIREAVALLEEAQRPVIIAGGGVHYSEAWRELQEFAEALGIPVGETFAGKGALKESSPLALGGHRPGGNRGGGGDRQPGRPGDLRRHAADRLRHRLAVVLSAIPRCDSSASTSAATTHPSKVRCRSSPTPARRSRSLHKAALAAGVRPRAGLPGRGCRRAAQLGRNDPAARSHAHHAGEAMSQGELIRLLNREARAGRHGHRRRGRPARRPAQAVGCDRRPALPPGVRLLVHGLRDPRRPGRPAGAARGRGLRLDRRRHLPDEPDRADDRGPGGPQDHRRVSPRTTATSASAGSRCGGRASASATSSAAATPRTNRLEGEYVRIDLAKNAESFGAERGTSRLPSNCARRCARPGPNARACVIVAETEKHRFLPGGGIWWDVAPAEVSQDPKTRELRAEYEQDRGRLQRLHY